MLGLFIHLVRPSPVLGRCRPEPVTVNTPSGIAGCYQWGDGIASHYGPGNGVAMNFCTWSLRHKEGCGWVRITSRDTGRSVDAPVVDFCDCYWLSDRRIVDLQYGVVQQLGLSLNRGLYRVTVWPLSAQTPISRSLPDTAMPASVAGQ